MAFPASNGSIPLTLEAAWAGARQAAQQVQQQANALSGQIPSGVSAQQILNSCNYFAILHQQLTTYAAVPGIATYAQAQINNSTFDVATAFSAMQTALVNVISWIATNFPTTSFVTFSTAGLVQYTIFTQAQLSPLATLLTTLSATID